MYHLINGQKIGNRLAKDSLAVCSAGPYLDKEAVSNNRKNRPLGQVSLAKIERKH
jgi:hypothetical protein